MRKASPQALSRKSPPSSLLCGLVIVVAGAIAYSNSFRGVFLLDDFGHIVTSESIKGVFPLIEHWQADRPLVHLTLSINYAISGLDTWSYHVFNLLVHLGAGLVLMGLARRLLLLRPAGLDVRSAVIISFVIALLWTIHPLQTQSVTYIIQRGESMMGLFYLLTLYGFVRGAEGGRSWAWYSLSVLACAAGMVTKEAMVTAPVMVFLVDAIFISRSWVAPLKRRWPLYLLLVSTIGFLAAQGLFSDILHGSRKHGADIGFQVAGLSPIRYLLTQPEVILHYLRLCFWPYPQCFDYGWQAVSDWRQAVLPGLVILAMLAATVALLLRRPDFGFLGAWWFIILAPTSSIVPIKDFAFEQRMYLPLAAVIAAVLLAGRRLIRKRMSAPLAVRLNAALVVIVAMTLGARTIRRNADYASASVMWADVVRQRPSHVRAWNYLGVGLAVEGRQEEAIWAYESALALEPGSEEVHSNLARALVKAGRAAEALPHFQESLRKSPGDANLHHSYAIALEKTGRIDESLAEYRRTLELEPGHPFARYNMGLALKAAGRWEEAARAFAESTRADPGDASGFYQLGYCLTQLGRKSEATAALQTALRLNPADRATRILLQSLQGR